VFRLPQRSTIAKLSKEVFMRSTNLLVALLVFAVPSIVNAQYDFDDFINAVEAGQAKTPVSAPSLEMPQLAQIPSGSVTANADGINMPQAVPAESPVQLEPIQFSMIEDYPPPMQVNFEELFQQQDVGLADPSRPCSCNSAPAACQSCRHARHHRQCTVMPYQTPELPAPASLRGYFNASPCIANVWDGYACEASAHCAKTQQRINGTNGKCHRCARGKQPCD